MSDTSVCTKNSRYASFFLPEKAAKSRFLDTKKMPLQHPLDAIMMLTFFDAVVIAIATCSYRDDNMMLSTCVHVAINLANATYLLHKQNTRKKDCINIQKHRLRKTKQNSPEKEYRISSRCHKLPYILYIWYKKKRRHLAWRYLRFLDISLIIFYCWKSKYIGRTANPKEGRFEANGFTSPPTRKRLPSR